MTYQPPSSGYSPAPYPGQPSAPPYSGGYPNDYGNGYPLPTSKTPIIALSVVGVLLLLAIIGVTGFALVNKDDDSGDDTASSKNDPSPSKKPTSRPTPEPSTGHGGDTVGNSATPYQFEVPTSFEEVEPPSSEYIEDNQPSYEHAVSPTSARSSADVIIVSAWGGQEDESDIGDSELKRMMDDVATNLRHTSPGKTVNINGHRGRKYIKSDTINTFVLAGTTFIQIRCQFAQEEKKIESGCDQVLDSITFK